MHNQPQLAKTHRIPSAVSSRNKQGAAVQQRGHRTNRPKPHKKTTSKTAVRISKDPPVQECGQLVPPRLPRPFSRLTRHQLQPRVGRGRAQLREGPGQQGEVAVGGAAQPPRAEPAGCGHAIRSYDPGVCTHGTRDAGQGTVTRYSMLSVWRSQGCLCLARCRYSHNVQACCPYYFRQLAFRTRCPAAGRLYRPQTSVGPIQHQIADPPRSNIPAHASRTRT